MTASLFVIQGRDQGTRFELDSHSVSFPLGRDTGNHIQLHDTEVSRRHAELRRNGDMFLISDLGSSNGTFVNNQRIQQQELASGDQVQIGRTVMLFTGLGEAPSSSFGAQVNIGGVDSGEQSRILHSVSREEGSRIFSPDLTIGMDTSQGQWLARARSNLQIMYRTALAVSHTLDIDQLLRRIMQLIFEWVEADRGCIMLLDPETKQLRPKVRRDRKGHRSDVPSHSRRADHDQQDDSRLRHAALRRRAHQRRPARRPLGHRRQHRAWGVREAICVPMQGRYDVVGVIYIDTSTPPGHALDRITGKFGANKFTEEHLKLMVAIGHQAALAVEDTNYYSAMVQAERLAAVGQTIATLSHHIKNILQGIRGGSYLIEMGLADHDEEVVGKGWDIVERNQSKISALVMDMLTFSKEREPDFAAADLNAVVGEVIELMQSRADELKVQLRWEAGCDDSPAHVRSRGHSPGRAEYRHQRPRRLRSARRRRWSSVRTEQLPQSRHRASQRRRQRHRHRRREFEADFQSLLFEQGRPRHGLGPGGEPKDFEGARRPDSRRKPARRRKPFHAGISRHARGRRTKPPRATERHRAPSPSDGKVIARTES